MHKKLNVSYLPIGQIKAFSGNARTHGKEQVQQIAKSIKTFGFINPVLIDDAGVLVAGHARLLAAQQLGLEVIPTICIDHLSEAEKRAYILADNRLAENAGWDEDLLRVELEFLTSIDIDFDASLTGFSVAETDLLLSATDEQSLEDEVPKTPEPTAVVTRPGDLWLLGSHRVICGDCRDEQIIDRLMDGVEANMVLTDPPYNCRVQGHVSGLGKHTHREFAMASGELDPEEFFHFLRESLGQLARVSVDGSLHFVFMDWRGLPALNTASIFVHDRVLNLCVWVKSNGGMGALYRSQHEMILVAKKGKTPHQNNVELGRHGRYRTNVWHYPGANSFGANRDEALAMHPTVKPVQMLADAIMDVTNRNDIVLDGFLGSGSTLMAAELTGRICFGTEIDPAYVDVILERYERHTGHSPIRASDNRAFHDLRCLGEQEVEDEKA